MPKKTSKPQRLNKTVKDNHYSIITAGPKGKTLTKRVEADDVAYGVIGIRKENKVTVLDHIPSGMKIAQFKTGLRARSAIVELMQVTDFNWIEPPARIKPEVKEILERWAA